MMFEQLPSLCSADIRILTHHIYECKKGLQQIAPYTMNRHERHDAERILNKRRISYFIQEVSLYKLNIFLGDEMCIKILRSFKKDSLTDYTPEQDFIFGIMLGYDRKQQF